MPAPTPSWNLVRVYGTWTETEDGTLKAGKWIASLPERITNATDDVMIPAGPFASGNLNTVRSIGSGVSLDVQLPAYDDPDNTPLNVRPIITVTFTDGSKPETFQPPVPVALSGDPVGVDLRLYSPINLATAVIDYAPADYVAGLKIQLAAIGARLTAAEAALAAGGGTVTPPSTTSNVLPFTLPHTLGA